MGSNNAWFRVIFFPIQSSRLVGSPIQKLFIPGFLAQFECQSIAFISSMRNFLLVSLVFCDLEFFLGAQSITFSDGDVDITDAWLTGVFCHQA